MINQSRMCDKGVGDGLKDRKTNYLLSHFSTNFFPDSSHTILMPSHTQELLWVLNGEF